MTKKMNTPAQTELKELQAAIAEVSLRDVHLGRVLDTIATHLAHAFGLEYPVPEQQEQPAEETMNTQEGVN